MQFLSRRPCSTRCCWFLFDFEPLNIFLSLQLVEDTLLQNNLEKSNTTRLLLNLVSLRILNSYLNLNFCPINNVKFRDWPKTKFLRDFYTCFSIFLEIAKPSPRFQIPKIHDITLCSFLTSRIIQNYTIRSDFDGKHDST